jgi:hypothetical protein
MVVVLSLGLPPSHPDHALLKRIEDKIIEHAEGWERFRREVPNLIRQGIDEVIDAARSQRFTLDELKRIERAYIGIKIKILFRDRLGLERGKVLDLLVDGAEVAVRCTVGSTWTVPKKAVGQPCIFIKVNERSARYCLGIAVIRPEFSSPALRRDRRTAVAQRAQADIRWIVRGAPYPHNPWGGRRCG